MLEKPIPKTWEDKNALNRKIKPKQNTKAENWKLVDSPSNPKVSCLLFDPGTMTITIIFDYWGKLSI